MSSDVDHPPQPINEDLIADAELAIRIYEEDEPVGVVNIDAKTYEYHGSSTQIEDRLDQMERRGLWYRAPADDQPENPYHTPTTKIERTGKHLGQYLTRRLERIPLNDTNVRTEPIGFEREHPDETPDEPLGTDASGNTQ